MDYGETQTFLHTPLKCRVRGVRFRTERCGVQFMAYARTSRQNTDSIAEAIGFVTFGYKAYLSIFGVEGLGLGVQV